MKRWKHWIVLLFAGLIVAAYALIRYPFYSADEVEEARNAVMMLRQQAGSIECSRSALGDATPATQAEFDAYRFQDEFGRNEDQGTCGGAFASREPFFDGEESEESGLWSWIGDWDDLPTNWRFGAPFPPPNQATPRWVHLCAGALERVDAIAAATNLCSPFRPGAPSWGHYGGHAGSRQLGAMVAATVPWWARDHDPFDAFVRGLRGVVALRTFRRGPTSAETVKNSADAETAVVFELRKLLFADAGFTEAQYDELDASLETIQRESPINTPGLLVTILDYSFLQRLGEVEQGFLGVGLGDVTLRDHHQQRSLVYAHRQRVCPGEELTEECLRVLHSDLEKQVLRTVTTSSFERRFRSEIEKLELYRPSIVRRAEYEEQLLEQMAMGIEGALQALVNAEARLQSLRILVRLARRRAKDATCPPSIDPDWLDLPHSDENLEVIHVAGDLYSIAAPWMVIRLWMDGSGDTLFSCPPATAGWVSHDDPVHSRNNLPVY